MAESNTREPEGISPPAFWSALKEGDAAALAVQNRGRTSRIRRPRSRAALPLRLPQAVVSAPLSRGMKPFPTLFWLTCPFPQGRRCGELESMQKIAELEKLFASMPEDIARYHADYAALRLSLIPDGAKRALESENPAMFAVLAEAASAA